MKWIVLPVLVCAGCAAMAGCQKKALWEKSLAVQQRALDEPRVWLGSIK